MLLQRRRLALAFCFARELLRDVQALSSLEREPRVLAASYSPRASESVLFKRAGPGEGERVLKMRELGDPSLEKGEEETALGVTGKDRIYESTQK